MYLTSQFSHSDKVPLMSICVKEDGGSISLSLDSTFWSVAELHMTLGQASTTMKQLHSNIIEVHVLKQAHVDWRIYFTYTYIDVNLNVHFSSAPHFTVLCFIVGRKLAVTA